MSSLPITICDGVDREWADKCPIQLDVAGYDGDGWNNVNVPLTLDELDEIITLLQDAKTKLVGEHD